MQKPDTAKGFLYPVDGRIDEDRKKVADIKMQSAIDAVSLLAA